MRFSFTTTWTGEAEIAAWEIASGCGRHYVAWLLNLQAWAIGLALAPGAVFCAFVRGRARTNLYRKTFDERWLEETLGTLRHCLGLNRPPPPPAPLDRPLFTLWSAAATVVLAASAAPWIAVPRWLVSVLT